MTRNADHRQGKPLRKVQDFIQLPLLYDYWYVAGLADEFGRELRAKTLLERIPSVR